MPKKPRGVSRQPELFELSKRPTIPINPNHRLVLLTDETDWTELEERVEEIRMGKVKNAAGRPPHLRALMGALVLKATRDMTWREAEDLIRYYAPARYLCGLTETEWSPDHTTLHDFAVLLGEDGVRLLNEYMVGGQGEAGGPERGGRGHLLRRDVLVRAITHSGTMHRRARPSSRLPVGLLGHRHQAMSVRPVAITPASSGGSREIRRGGVGDLPASPLQRGCNQGTAAKSASRRRTPRTRGGVASRADRRGERPRLDVATVREGARRLR